MINHAELAPKRRNMRLHGTYGNEQALADLNMGEVVTHEIKHLRLAA